MVEQYGYPMTDRGGINLGLVEEGIGSIKGESGRVITTEVGSNVLYFEDGGYSMEAVMEEAYLRFAMYTRNIQTGVRHPDFFAKDFIIFAVNHFEENGYEVSSIMDVWPEWSENYKKFMEEYRQSCDVIAAAKSTWSGNVYGNLGFNAREDSVEVKQYPMFPKANKVIAYFDRI